ncbi:unnamed protein product [Calypogeia fissa]
MGGRGLGCERLGRGGLGEVWARGRARPIFFWREPMGGGEVWARELGRALPESEQEGSDKNILQGGFERGKEGDGGGGEGLGSRPRAGGGGGARVKKNWRDDGLAGKRWGGNAMGTMGWHSGTIKRT